VDLLWNGGIGTYVKASSESNTDVGDRSNDALRIDGRDLNCKVIGEGGNLGLSQLGRVEFARRGGRLNTDFIDNSAGVNCSDVEVNLKILLNGAVQAGELKLAARDRLLVQMTDDVAELVLRNNYLQSLAISTSEFQSKARLSESAYVIRALERYGGNRRAPQGRRGTHASGACHHPGLRQDLAVPGPDQFQCSGGSVPLHRTHPLLSASGAETLR
jgi:glutamate dehydrogenase